MVSCCRQAHLRQESTLGRGKPFDRVRPLGEDKPLDRDRLAAVYDEHYQPIYRYLFRQIGDVETTRDLTAEVFRRFLQATRAGSGPEQHLSAWLYRTAHNILVDHYRRQQYRQHLPLDEELVNVSDNPAESAERRVSAAQVRAALQQLTPDQQQVIVLKFLEGLSNQEVSAVLSKPVGAVKSLQHRALAALQRLLAPEKEIMLP
jgi:RNA polymerase sigma-70 factor (ECF subfamily)